MTNSQKIKLTKLTVKSNLLSPLPVVLVGVNVRNRPNYLAIGYISPFNFGKHIFFSLYKKRYSRIGLHENMTFSVNIPNENLMEQLEICGSKSGHTYDKSEVFTSFYGELETAPMIEEAPINIECKVVEILNYDPNEGIIGEVIGSYIDSRYYS
ncbi:MAG: flavin reductase family protein [Candidatus Kariarchaeaceae archaeon]|jgi:flavin reductase (DIM6/NTAB) family NADH-FMN oxidoreductase RutF